MSQPQVVDIFSKNSVFQENPDHIESADASMFSGGGGDGKGMSDRVTRLEAHFEYVRKDLDGIKATNEKILERLGDLPTKQDLKTNTLTVVVIGLTVMAITVGGIIGGLDWIKVH